ncbi:carboxymuconolactone decarboxylase family protein [Flavobacterium johnsoniae]|jgi:AhpD family alkylhydroperoxidase|uniref:Alkylhydroperoxidase like protein, AhpD family n=1 Tax=Flavobacterium johnsoniae (strain ATCC 17061 / DSM 2064 / JCM 8514 / BCRC 14874 / CCUG 350202 / NBRC 14942 / NCIMB 11054 / UW101) TaxID=376686 RepID=A5FDH0_FLAJ1|nr:carboxymuconolactone decarboxylase family protein [Flavobacterium johnsoniae]ABQ06747.1 alkylhydroperoxidase like protein, AhpD family [Flavobacterium johnsoniae UW101]OXE97390.1 carboxymuconolactone decarboxylase family protein [Flavobacterium johnsoniae UW101]WQG81424.1 carboxymuconolactone decarboxylase family protein [Flavobacterium johnsoniae UW101]SHL41947.1 alkylhydroperoxidase AhpD family core domain-containing protein [Flavobacterium johnsoniae]
MQKRLNIKQAAPDALKAMIGLESYLSKISISKTAKELIKIRASQINGCAYCINIHTQDAVKNGETNQRIFLLSAWREAGDIFTEEEKAVLAITEEITLIHQQGLSDQTYSSAVHFFSEKQIADIITAVITINLWNRVVLSTRLPIGQSLA